MKNIKVYTIAVCLVAFFGMSVTAQANSWSIVKLTSELQADDHDDPEEQHDVCTELFPLCEAHIDYSEKTAII
jgi:hypothetical protein